MSTYETIRPEAVEACVLDLLDDATDTKIGLPTEESAYTLQFLREMVAKISHNQERLSDMMLKLTRYSIDINRAAADTQALVRLTTIRLKESDEYANQPREKKTLWLDHELAADRSVAERWNGLRRVVSEVKEAVDQRAQMMKRLDSDLRLHAKLVELDRPAFGGVTSPAAYTGSKSPDLEID